MMLMKGALLTCVSEFAQDCGGDPLAPASLRADAKASLVASPQYGGDPTDYFEWTRQALDAVVKTSPPTSSRTSGRGDEVPSPLHLRCGFRPRPCAFRSQDSVASGFSRKAHSCLTTVST